MFAGSSLNRKSKSKVTPIKRKITLKNDSNALFESPLIENNYKYINHDNNPSALLEQERAFYEEDYNSYSSSSSIKTIIQVIEEIVKEEKIKKPRFMSPRTKQKIRKKVIAFSQAYKKLNFLTLTFINQVEDKQAVMLLARFLDNCNKQMKDFQYIWVAERQTKNEVFENNIHFHLITNKYFKIDKYWNYWISLQEKSGLKPREENFKASSAFDIRSLNAKNIKAIGQYITKYVTKNRDQFDCQVWNCSKKISMLYTDFYSGYEFIEDVEKVLEYELEPIPAEYCTIYPIPLNRKTLPMYNRLNEKNMIIANQVIQRVDYL
jgi:hypothetical protein